MTRKLTIKKEIRTLGLDLCNPRRLVGAVVRGGVYLDGVLVFPSNPIPESRSIASAILETRFFPELRLIMTHDPKARTDPRVIEKWTKLPVIQIIIRRYLVYSLSCINKCDLYIKAHFRVLVQ